MEVEKGEQKGGEGSMNLKACSMNEYKPSSNSFRLQQWRIFEEKTNQIQDPAKKKAGNLREVGQLNHIRSLPHMTGIARRDNVTQMIAQRLLI